MKKSSRDYRKMKRARKRMMANYEALMHAAYCGAIAARMWIQQIIKDYKIPNQLPYLSNLSEPQK